MHQVDLDNANRLKHEEAMDRLCEEYPDRREFIRDTYSEILKRVAADATVHTYGPIFISREVKTLLKMKELTRSSLS